MKLRDAFKLASLAVCIAETMFLLGVLTALVISGGRLTISEIPFIAVIEIVVLVPFIMGATATLLDFLEER